jgi:hypothetical protein
MNAATLRVPDFHLDYDADTGYVIRGRNYQTVRAGFNQYEASLGIGTTGVSQSQTVAHKRVMSKAARQRIADAQKKRWAAHNKTTAVAPAVPRRRTTKAPAPKVMTAAG